MRTTQLIEKYLSLPEDLRAEMDRFVELLLQKSKQYPASPGSPLADLDIADYNEPINPDDFALNQIQLQAIKEVWEGEEDAESLCQLLTA